MDYENKYIKYKAEYLKLKTNNILKTSIKKIAEIAKHKQILGMGNQSMELMKLVNSALKLSNI